jgi:PAS domain S-box-containing protein
MDDPATTDLLVDPRPLLTNLPGRAYIVSADYRVLYANPQAIAYLGRDPIGEACHVALGEKDEVCEDCRIERVLAGEPIIDQPFAQPDGSWRMANHYPLRLADGRDAKLTVVTDVTQNKLAEAALAESEAKYRQIFDAIDDGIVIHDAETGDYLEANRRVREMSGFEFEGRIPLSQIPQSPPRSLDGAIDLIHRAAAGEPQHFEWNNTSSAGVLLWQEIDLRPVQLGGQVRVVAVIRDITRRKRIELDLRQSEERYRQLIQNLEDAVFSLNQQGEFTFMSDAITRLSGFAPAEVVGRRFAEFIQPDDLERVAEQFQRCLAGAHIVSEFRVRVRDGSERVVRTSSRPVTQDGRVVGASGVMTDLTELRQAERSKRSLEEQLRHSQKMEALGRLAGGVAHDFNNLLFVILNHAQFLQHNLPEDDPGRHSATQIEKAADRAAELTRRLLDFSRRKAVITKVLDLNEVLAEMQEMLARIVGEDIELSTDLAPEIGRVEVDPANISQVLMNLVANARDAMPAGGRLRIETSQALIDAEEARRTPGLSAGPYAVLSVADSGVGMPAEVREHAFEPFYTTKSGGQSTGLGLSTVYSAVRQAGGHVEIESAPNNGTRVRVFLPCTEAWPTVTPVRGLRPLPRIKGKTVLVVEDQGSVRSLVTSMLEDLGAEVHAAPDGPQALAFSAEHPFAIDLLVTDVRMPGMSGPQLAMALRAQRPETRVLYISGWAGEDEISIQGADAPLLLKPFRADDLLEKLSEVLGPSG